MAWIGTTAGTLHECYSAILHSLGRVPLMLSAQIPVRYGDDQHPLTQGHCAAAVQTASATVQRLFLIGPVT
jgi:hypothetical protein